MVLLALLIIPVIIAIITFIIGKHKVTWKEFAIQMGVQVIIAAASVGIMYSSNTSDTEILNGRISKKQREEVTCSHTYCCSYGQCCSGSGKTRSCHTCCKMTCRRHPYDVDWMVYTNIGRAFDIDRLSNQGLEEPPRWTAVKIGEPYSGRHSYENYIKASPDSLFRNDGLVEKYKGSLPSYPSNVYDYHRLDRFITLGFTVENQREWNDKISEVAADLGVSSEANVVFVVGLDMSNDYYYALRQHWIGAKKNDIVVVASIDKDSNIQWTEIMAWSNDKMFEVVLRDHIMDVGVLEVDQILGHVKQDTLKYFKRKPMSDYEYLKSAITPTLTQWIVSMIIGLIVSIGLSVYMYTNDIEEDNGSGYYRRRRYY